MSIPNNFNWQDQLDLSNWDPQERAFVESLRDVLAALDAQRLEEHVALALRAPGGLHDREHLLDPAVYSLICYGPAGIDALRKLWLDGPRKVSMDAMRALIDCAYGQAESVLSHIALAHRYMDKISFERLWDTVIANCNAKETRGAADVAVSRCIKAVVTSEAPGFDIGMLLMGTTNPGVAPSVVTRILEELAQSALRLTGDLCDEFEALVERDLPETAYQSFLEAHPALVDPLASKIVNRQALAEQWKTDFVIRRLDNQYVFVEIEKPSDVPISDYPAPRASLAHAIGQVVNWFIWIEDNIAYAQKHGFPEIHNPRGVVVIGRDRDLSPAQRRHFDALSDALGPRIQLLTFDDVLRNARNVVKNMISRK